MNIIIAGAGKVGSTLAETLNEEGHNVTVIDVSEEVLSDLTEAVDIMGVVGNASSYNTLQEAGIEDTDLLIAVTQNDELNLLCCVIAKKANNCNTIARVRNPVYNLEAEFIKKAFDISLIINPELAAAAEIARLLSFPSASQIGAFAKGKAEILRYHIEEDSLLDGINLIELAKLISCDFLITTIERGAKVIIPNGNTIMQAGDEIHIIASLKNANILFKAIGAETEQVVNCMIIGGSTLGYYLAKYLLARGIETTIIEKDKKRCEELSASLPKAIIINGDATSEELLLEEGIETVESFVSLTNMDEENIMLSLYAKKHSPAKVVTKIKRSIFADVIKDLDIDSIISPKEITASQIISYVRALQNSYGSNVETVYKIVGNKVEALEFKVRPGAKCADIALTDIQLKDNILLACINRDGKIIIPKGSDMIMVGDGVVIVTTEKGLDDIDDILQ